MELYIIRHAEAQPIGRKNDFNDEKRALTSEGRDRMKEGAKALRKLGVELDLILTSPLVRAVETAEIVAGASGMSKKEIVQTDNLKPGAVRDKLFSEIKSQTGSESIAIVGHEPDLSAIISDVLHSDSSLPIELKKGSVAFLRVTETVPSLHGTLCWLLTLRQLRMLAKT
jgi:phosphohistidine phosphatase